MPGSGRELPGAAALATLDGERAYPPIFAAALALVLYVTGRGDRPEAISDARVEDALPELITAGRTEGI